MKVTGTGGLSQSSGVKPARAGGGGGEGFRIGGAAPLAAPISSPSVSSVSNVMGVEALLALQDVGTPTERKRRQVSRAGRLLDELDEIKIALLGGDLSTAQLDRLARAIREQREATDDPKLEGILNDIETRAAVELAKLESAHKSA
jgi:hypothetical protein